MPNRHLACSTDRRSLFWEVRERSLLSNGDRIGSDVASATLRDRSKRRRKTNSIFNELAQYRRQLGLPPAGSEADRSTIAKLEISGRTFFGINSSSNPYSREITLRVNPITKTHAEADAFQQAADAGVGGGKARLIVDRDLCAPCGIRGGVNSFGLAIRHRRIRNRCPQRHQDNNR